MEEIVIGGYYKHFKGHTCHVFAVAEDEDGNEVALYTHDESGDKVWTRKLYEGKAPFFSTVNQNIKRFTLIDGD